MQDLQGNRRSARALTSVLFGEIEAPIPLYTTGAYSHNRQCDAWSLMQSLCLRPPTGSQHNKLSYMLVTVAKYNLGLQRTASHNG